MGLDSEAGSTEYMRGDNQGRAGKFGGVRVSDAPSVSALHDIGQYAGYIL